MCLEKDRHINIGWGTKWPVFLFFINLYSIYLLTKSVILCFASSSFQKIHVWPFSLRTFNSPLSLFTLILGILIDSNEQMRVCLHTVQRNKVKNIGMYKSQNSFNN